MIAKHGNNECIIVGSSTHNKCIERLWREVHRSVIVLYSNLFRMMEEDEILDPLNEIDVYCLHLVFLPKINESFQEGWNNHMKKT